MPKRSKNAPKVTKTSFVRSLSPTMPAKEVVKLAKAQGLTITEGYVYEIRSAAKRKKKGLGRGAGSRRAATSGSSESTFRKLVLDLGLARSRDLLDQMERRLGDLVAGR